MAELLVLTLRDISQDWKGWKTENLLSASDVENIKTEIVLG